MVHQSAAMPLTSCQVSFTSASNKSDGTKIESTCSGHDFRDRFWAPFKGHMNGHDSGTGQEAFRAHMDSAPDTRRGKIERTRLGSGGGNKVTNSLKAPRR